MQIKCIFALKMKYERIIDKRIFPVFSLTKSVRIRKKLFQLVLYDLKYANHSFHVPFNTTEPNNYCRNSVTLECHTKNQNNLTVSSGEISDLKIWQFNWLKTKIIKVSFQFISPSLKCFHLAS